MNNNGTLDYDFNNQYSNDLISYMDIENHIILLSIFIMIFSILLVIEVNKSRNRILANFEREEYEYFFNNVKLAITSIFLDIVYMFTSTISIL